MHTNTKSQGEKSEAHILAAVLEKGFAAAIPFGNNQRYDLILDTGEELILAQCKTGWLEGGTVTFSVSSKNGFTGERQSYRGEVDIFLVYSPDLKKVYRVPVEDAPTVQMKLRVEPLENCEDKKGVHWAKDFEL